jgi:enterochelin esterase-like enzyme
VITHAGRLEPVAALIEAARTDSNDLAARLKEHFPALEAEAERAALFALILGESMPAGLGMGGCAVWRDTAIFAVASERPPRLLIGNDKPLPMTQVRGTPYWIALRAIETGGLHTYRYLVDGESGPLQDVAGYSALSNELPGIKVGTLSGRRSVASEIYPGATTEYWIYASDGIDEVRGAPVMIWLDGYALLDPSDLDGLRVKIVSDNLVALNLIPPLVHLLVSPSDSGDEVNFQDLPDELTGKFHRSMRTVQYALVSAKYGRHLLEEVLPHAGQEVKLRTDGYSRGSGGGSGAAMGAFALAWTTPHEFSRVLMNVPGVPLGPTYSDLVRKEEKRNIRVWLSLGSNDIDHPDGTRDTALFRGGGSPLNGIMLANALKGAGYDFRFRFGEGTHGGGQAALDLPESLAWLWRDYDPDRTEQAFVQDPAEAGRPVFRVAISNREA